MLFGPTGSHPEIHPRYIAISHDIATPKYREVLQYEEKLIWTYFSNLCPYFYFCPCALPLSSLTLVRWNEKSLLLSPFQLWVYCGFTVCLSSFRHRLYLPPFPFRPSLCFSDLCDCSSSIAAAYSPTPLQQLSTVWSSI